MKREINKSIDLAAKELDKTIDYLTDVQVLSENKLIEHKAKEIIVKLEAVIPEINVLNTMVQRMNKLNEHS